MTTYSCVQICTNKLKQCDPDQRNYNDFLFLPLFKDIGIPIKATFLPLLDRKISHRSGFDCLLTIENLCTFSVIQYNCVL